MSVLLARARRTVAFALLFSLAACLAQPPTPDTNTRPTAAAQASAPTNAPATLAPSSTASPVPPPTLAPTATPVPGVLYVDADQRLGPISRLVYGSNYGPWMGGFLPDVQRQVDASAITFLRFPGGEWGDQHNLEAQQIDDFIALCRRLGAEPSISARLRGGTPEQAAALVRYVNITKRYGVRYWSIGNEPSLYSEYDIARAVKEWRVIALAMRAVDPQIVLIGPDIHQFDSQGTLRSPNGQFSMHEFLRAFLRANGDLVDIVAIHRYPFPVHPNDGDPTKAQLRENSREWDALIPALRELIRGTLGHNLPVAVTEVNSNWTPTFGGDATPDSLYGAIWWGDVLGRLIRQRVDIVAQFALYAPGSDGWGLLRAYSTRPAYYVYQLYQRFGTEQVYASSDDPLITIVAARRADGALTLMLINLGSEPRAKPLKLDHFAPAAHAETWRLDREHNGSQIELTVLGQTLHLPPESITLLIAMPRS